MSLVWDKVSNCAATMQTMMESAGWRNHDPLLDKYSWENHIYQGDQYRRGHIEIVDKRDSHGLYILHATIFPHLDNSAPIWGFDAVCGKSKITGAFHDFSLTANSHPMYDWFADTVKDITWKKERELPEWAQRIFSPSMVAAGNIQELEELDSLCELGIKTLDYYLSNVGTTRVAVGRKFIDEQNYYCQNQKQNPHVVRSMVAMGFEQAVIEQFVDEVLFPEIN